MYIISTDVRNTLVWYERERDRVCVHIGGMGIGVRLGISYLGHDLP